MKKTLYNIEKIEIYSEEYKEYEQSEKTMLKSEQTSNIKPDEWYEEVEQKYNELIYSNDFALIIKSEDL